MANEKKPSLEDYLHSSTNPEWLKRLKTEPDRYGKLRQLLKRLREQRDTYSKEILADVEEILSDLSIDIC